MPTDCSLCGAFTMDVIASTAFGVKVDSHNDPNNQFVRMAKKAFEVSFASFNAILFCEFIRIFSVFVISLNSQISTNDFRDVAGRCLTILLSGTGL